MLLVRLLCGWLEGGQGLIPEVVEIHAKCSYAFGVELVDPTGSLVPGGHEVRVLQDLQVLRDGGTADRQLARELADGAGAIGEPLEDRPPRWVGERGEPLRSVSQHER